MTAVIFIIREMFKPLIPYPLFCNFSNYLRISIRFCIWRHLNKILKRTKIILVLFANLEAKRVQNGTHKRKAYLLQTSLRKNKVFQPSAELDHFVVEIVVILCGTLHYGNFLQTTCCFYIYPTEYLKIMETITSMFLLND
jgi:hypothetical protein